jgi:hypothetical protein
MLVRCSAITVLVAALCIPAPAFQEGGHFSSLVAIFSGVHGQRPELDDARRIEAFCAELPDRSRDLDAISQRFKVLFDPREFQWGARGKCTGPVTRHMVAVHYYLHALTGGDAAQLQRSALKIRELLVRDAGIETNDDRKASLLCAVGFADHLLGDTRAHIQLATSTDTCSSVPLYSTGRGHLFDGSTPDHLFARSKQACGGAYWATWFSDAASTLVNDRSVGDELVQQVKHWAEMQHIDLDDESIRSRQDIEDLLQAALRTYPKDKYHALAALKPSPQNALFAQTDRCVDQVANFFTGDQAVQHRPRCQTAWDLFLAKAVDQFPYLPHDPSCRVSRDKPDLLDDDPTH